MLLCVEAMLLALKDGIGTILVASSDRDFTYLAEALRETGVRVIGLGTDKAPNSFREACTHFIDFAPASAAQTAPKPAAPTPVPAVAPAPARKTLSDIEALVITWIQDAGAPGLPIQSLGPLMNKLGLHIAKTPEKTWRNWFKARTPLFDLYHKGSTVRARLRA
jgi:hypothetical protein